MEVCWFDCLFDQIFGVMCYFLDLERLWYVF